MGWSMIPPPRQGVTTGRLVDVLHLLDPNGSWQTYDSSNFIFCKSTFIIIYVRLCVYVCM